MGNKADLKGWTEARRSDDDRARTDNCGRQQGITITEKALEHIRAAVQKEGIRGGAKAACGWAFRAADARD